MKVPCYVFDTPLADLRFSVCLCTLKCANFADSLGRPIKAEQACRFGGSFWSRGLTRKRVFPRGGCASLANATPATRPPEKSKHPSAVN